MSAIPVCDFSTFTISLSLPENNSSHHLSHQSGQISII